MYVAALGLDFIFLSGLQLHIADGKYFLKCVAGVEYFFQPGQASIPTNRVSCPQKTKQFESSQQNLSLLRAVPLPQLLLASRETDSIEDQVLIDKAIMKAILPH